MRTRHAAKIRNGIELALRHHRDRRTPQAPDWDRILDDIHDEERDMFLASRLERRAYWATRFKHFGMGWVLSRTGAAV